MSSNSEDHDDLLSSFQTITGQSTERSKFYLESSNWKLEVALSSFYENADEQVEELPAESDVPPSSVSDQETKRTTSKVQPQGSSFNRIATLRNTHNDDDDDSDSDDHQQSFYAGGGPTSGQQILGPPSSKKSVSSFVSKIFERARQEGAEVVDTHSGPSSSSHRHAFTGRGFRLGSTDSETTGGAASGTSDTNETTKKKDENTTNRTFILKMWSNGFSVNDGQLRPYDEPANRAFLASVMTGRIPDELVKEAKGGQVHLDMEDHKHEEYQPPKVKTVAFQGAGHVLGGIVPEVATNSNSQQSLASSLKTSESSSKSAKELEDDAKKSVNFDASQPSTQIQVRCSNNPNFQRLVCTLNSERSTVGDLRRYIQTARPVEVVASGGFTMQATFPNRQLDDDSKTLKEENLLNSCVMLRFS